MKRMILTGILGLALAGAGVQSARAGNCGWVAAGAALAGVTVGALVVAAADNHAQCNVSYTYGAPAYCPPPCPVAYYPAPPPVVVCLAPAAAYPRHCWNNGYYHRRDRW